MSDYKDWDDFHHEISEWWDHEGTYHPGAPDDDDLLNEATQITIHAWDDAGNDMYWTAFSDDGWDIDEYHGDVEDGFNHYVES